MKWVNFLHIYQPSGQQPDILEAVIKQSYRPILEGIKNHPRVRLSFNVSGALFEIFDKFGYHDVIDLIRELVASRRLELTGSAKFHALLPFLDETEMVRQISANTETLKFYVGKTFQPRGFFPPEMAYQERVARVVADQGFSWMILDEIAGNGKTESLKYDRVYQMEGAPLKVVFRERRPSNLIMSAVVRSVDGLHEAFREEFADPHRYVLTAMDGETFGHHRPGLENFLFETFNDPQCEFVTISELIASYSTADSIEPVPSTWASSQEDIARGVQFLSWSDPDNPIHTWQWELVRLALSCVYAMPESHPQHASVRRAMDEALASDHFWWASAKPWWSLEEIERGAYANLSVIRSIPDTPSAQLEKAAELYERIVSTAFHWKRSGRIYQLMKERNETVKIPFKERTLEKGGAEQGVYEAFVQMLKDLEHQASIRGEYEKAILWRDALYKIEHKTDVYDAVHAVELVRLEIPNADVERMIESYKDRYRDIRGGQPEQRG